MYLNGLMLISSGARHRHARVPPSATTWPYPLFLPTYAAIAHYHGLHGDRPLRDVLAEAEEFAGRDYPWALARGNRLSAAERADGGRARLARLTGLSEDYVDRVDLRIEHVRFFTELLRDARAHRRPARRAVHRLGRRLRPRALRATTRRSTRSWARTRAALNHYLRDELELRATTCPTRSSPAQVHPWSYKEFEGQHVNVADKLAAGDARQPAPAGARRLRLPRRRDAVLRRRAHASPTCEIPAELRANIEFSYYEAGHMMYVHEPIRVAQAGRSVGDIATVSCST